MTITSSCARVLGATVLALTLIVSAQAGAQASTKAGPQAGPPGGGQAGPQAARAPGGPSGPVIGPHVPLPNIELLVRGPGTRPIPPLRTNARGEFSVQLPEGEYRVTASGRQVAGVVKSLQCCPGDVDGDGTGDLNVGVSLKHAEQSVDRGRAGGVSYLKITFQDVLVSSIRIPKGGATFAGQLWAIGGPRK